VLEALGKQADMFNVGFGELAVIVLVCLVVFGPERLPEVARQIGRFIGQARLYTQRMLDELRSESELKDLNLPDLKVGNLRRQARNYVSELLDVEGQMAELEQDAKPRPKPAGTKRTRTARAAGAAGTDAAAGAAEAAGTAEAAGDVATAPPVDPDAT
jgi:sec-independent protein translocase protein TatB